MFQQKKKKNKQKQTPPGFVSCWTPEATVYCQLPSPPHNCIIDSNHNAACVHQHLFTVCFWQQPGKTSRNIFKMNSTVLRKKTNQSAEQWDKMKVQGTQCSTCILFPHATNRKWIKHGGGLGEPEFKVGAGPLRFHPQLHGRETGHTNVHIFNLLPSAFPPSGPCW